VDGNINGEGNKLVIGIGHPIFFDDGVGPTELVSVIIIMDLFFGLFWSIGLFTLSLLMMVLVQLSWF